MTAMNPSGSVPELVLSGAMNYIEEIVSTGQRSILVNARTENVSAVDVRAWARRTIGRELGDFTLYIRHPSHVEEYTVADGQARSAVHPVWNYLERGIDTLVPLLRGEWDGNQGVDELGNAWPVGPAKGQKGYKLFICGLPSSATMTAKMLAKFFSDALASGLVVPKVYHDGVKGLVGGLNFGGHGVVYNPDYPARHGEIITCQGRQILVKNTQDLVQARHALAAVGYEPKDIAAADVSGLRVFNILSARWAVENWHKDVMPVGPKAQVGGVEMATA